MQQFLATLKKEALLVLNDKVGLLLLYLMPIALVVIITLVQDSSFRMASGNSISVLVVNDDTGSSGDSLVELLRASGSFRLHLSKGLSAKQITRSLSEEGHLLAIRIPADFTQRLGEKASRVTNQMLSEFGVKDSVSHPHAQKSTDIAIYYDPVLQANYRLSVTNSIYSSLATIENKLLLERLYSEMGYDRVPASIRAELAERPVGISEHSASGSANSPIPNATQHNVPAWSVFAMFFMVVSLGGNIVKERLNGSFVRLQTIPTSFRLVLCSKMLVYLFVAMTQLLLILLIGMFVFPAMGLPRLELPQQLAALILVSLLSGLAAVSYAVLIGTYAKTLEQANGFGAISILLFAAIGGIWVPSFVMPAYLQHLGQVSPLYWCLKGFYALFLQGGNWNALGSTLIFLTAFITLCQLLVWIKLKVQRYH